LDEYKGTFVKITSFGLRYLPAGKYKIIYSERNIEEILDSMEKMADIVDSEREKTKDSFIKLNIMIKNLISEREDADVLIVNYNEILSNPSDNIKKIHDFLGIQELNLEEMISAVDKKLYRQRRNI